jgi:hypothetical protein
MSDHAMSTQVVDVAPLVSIPENLLTLNGIVLGVFDRDPNADKGYEGFSKVQILGNTLLPNGQVQASLHDLKVSNPEYYRQRQGQMVHVAVGTMIHAGAVLLYAVKK